MFKFCGRVADLVQVASEDDAWERVLSHDEKILSWGPNDAACQYGGCAVSTLQGDLVRNGARAHINYTMEALEPRNLPTRKPHTRAWQRTRAKQCITLEHMRLLNARSQRTHWPRAAQNLNGHGTQSINSRACEARPRSSRKSPPSHC